MVFCNFLLEFLGNTFTFWAIFMMLKNILFSISSIFLIFSFFYSPVFSNEANEDISKSDFTINVWDITPTWTDTLSWKTSAEAIDFTLETIITKLITAFWVLSLLVMTVGAWFMIIYHGQDELLTRWKSIFSYGLISLVVALSAWFLVKLVSYLLYWS